MKETHATITLNEKAILALLKEHYKGKGMTLFDYQFYKEGDYIYTDIRVKNDTESDSDGLSPDNIWV